MKARYIIVEAHVREHVDDLELTDPLHLPRRGDSVILPAKDDGEPITFFVSQLTHRPKEDLTLVQLYADGFEGYVEPYSVPESNARALVNVLNPRRD